MSIEQAIFTSAQTKQGTGYHLVCRSHGVSDADARELTAWGPSHDSLAARKHSLRSINFFHLTSGNFCVSTSVRSGQEYSERGGERIYTHCLVVAPADFARFANNPFAVVRAALAAGELDEREVFPHWMEPVLLGGRTARVDHTLLYRVTARVPPDVMVRLVSKVFENERLVVVTALDPVLLIAGLVNTLPLDRRPELSFSTGLRSSTQRPFRVVVHAQTTDHDAHFAEPSGAVVYHFDRELEASAAIASPMLVG